MFEMPNDRNPVILVPGLGGSMLEAKDNECLREDKHQCIKDCVNAEWHKIQLNLSNWKFNIFKECVMNKLKLKFDPFKMVWNSERNIEVRVKGEGTLESIEQLDLDSNISKQWTTYQGNLTRVLKHQGYIENYNIVGFPQDWRQTMDAFAKDYGQHPAGTFLHLKLQVEETFNRTKKKVTFISHSMGGLLVNQFLTKQVSREWVKQQVMKFIPISCPWGGAVESVHSFISGVNQFFNKNQLIETIRTFPSTMFLFPTEDLFRTRDRALMQFDGKPKKIDEFKDILYSLGKQESSLALQYLKASGMTLNNLKRFPDIPISFIWSSRIPTLKKMKFSKPVDKAFNQSPQRKIQGDGDGTVNIESLLQFKKQENYQSLSTFEVSIENVNHSNILSSNRFIEIILMQLEIEQ